MLRNTISAFCLTLLCVLTAGCGPAELPFTDNSKDTVAFARDIKQLVLNTVEQVKSSPQPADSIRVIVQTLSELDVSPTGEHLKTYQELHALSSTLLEQCEKGKPANFQAQIAEIAAIAKTLPGEVSIDKNARSDK